MGGFRLCCLGPLARHNRLPDASCDCEEITLRNTSVVEAISLGFLPPEPPVTKQEILDLSKAGTFAKLVAIWQISWFIIEVITRLSRHLPIALLEVGVTGFALLSLTTWCLYLEKPKSVNVGTRIHFRMPPDSKIQQELEDQIGKDLGDMDVQGETKILIDSLKFSHKISSERRNSIVYELFAHLRTWNENDSTGSAPFLITLTTAAFLAIPFGAVHVAAWNSIFPTTADQQLWRCSSIISMLGPLTFTLPYLFTWWLEVIGALKGEPKVKAEKVIETMFYCSWVLYVVSRCILIVEMVRCMLYLPPESYVTTWTTNVPHFG